MMIDLAISNFNHKPQRITEQDVLTILTNFYEWGSLQNWSADGEKYLNDVGRALLAKLNEHRETSTVNKAEVMDWEKLERVGQIKAGYWMSFIVGGKRVCAKAKEIIYPSLPHEEILYNRKKNHYMITKMVLDGTSSHKNVYVLPPIKDDEK